MPTNVNAATEVWQLDGAHTLVEFAVKHMMIATVKGRFGGVRGTVTRDPAAPDAPTIEVEIDVATVDTGVAQRDDHLRSPDFFDARAHPTIAYRASRIERTGRDTFRVHGDLTIRGVTRHVMLDVEEQGRATDPYGVERLGLSARTRINRKDFGLTWNVALEAGGVMVAEDVNVSLEIELVRATASDAQAA